MTDLTMLRRLGLAPLVNAVVSLASRGNLDGIRTRYLWQAMQPLDPLLSPGAEQALPEIDVLIPAHPKDLDVLRFAVAAVRRGTRNPVRRIVLVVPDSEVESIAASFGSSCQVVAEGTVLDSLLPWIREHVPLDWRGWVLQQAIKLLWVRGNDVPTLVLDSDTLLVKPRTWVDAAGRQLLCISVERHAEYVRHAGRCWPLSRAAQASSYVTHHQLMRPPVLARMFPDGQKSVQQWIEAADFSRASALSEYHCYGAWLREHQPASVAIGSFSNRGRDRDELADASEGKSLDAVLDVLAARYPERASLSFHSWRSDT